MMCLTRNQWFLAFVELAIEETGEQRLYRAIVVTDPSDLTR